MGPGDRAGPAVELDEVYLPVGAAACGVPAFLDGRDLGPGNEAAPEDRVELHARGGEQGRSRGVVVHVQGNDHDEDSAQRAPPPARGGRGDEHRHHHETDESRGGDARAPLVPGAFGCVEADPGRLPVRCALPLRHTSVPPRIRS
ncbi:hypothetical protein GCM10020256_51560 [Streptomyces thermocoprophilus]